MLSPRVLAALTLAVQLAAPSLAADKPAALVMGESFTIDSQILGETRRINVYRPPAAASSLPMRRFRCFTCRMEAWPKTSCMSPDLCKSW